MTSETKIGPVLALSAAGLTTDLMVELSVLWTLNSLGASKIALGIALATAALVPYAIEHFALGLLERLARRPLRSFVWIRAGSMVTCLGLAWLGRYSLAAPLYVVAAVNAVCSTLAAQSIDAHVTTVMFRGRITPNQAARHVQIAAQLGCFVAGASVGLTLDAGGLTLAALVAAAVAAIVTLVARSWGSREVECDIVPPPRPSAPIGGGLSRRSLIAVIVAFAALVVLSIQMSCENLLLVALVQDERRWSASIFGVLDAAFCVGALLGALRAWGKGHERLASAVFSMGIAAAAVLIARTLTVATATLGVVAYGFCFNVVRVLQRQVFFAAASTSTQVALWSGRLASARMLVESIVPIALGVALGYIAPSQGYIAMGGLVGGALLVIQLVMAVLPSRLVAPQPPASREA